MTAQGLTGYRSAPILNRVRGWELVVLGLSGWITLYSAALMNFQKGVAEMAGHSQGFFFAAAMVLGGAEARKRCLERSRRRKMQEAYAWADDMTEADFEDHLTSYYAAHEYRLESVTPDQRQLGFCLRVVRDGRTSLVHSGFWRKDNINEEELLRLAKAHANGVIFDRVTVLTRAEVSEATRKRMPATQWQVISGADFLALNRELQTFTNAPLHSEAAPTQKTH